MSLEPLIPNRLDDENSALVVLDQTLLPGEVIYRALHTTEEICHAIKTLQVRGAPAIGVAKPPQKKALTLFTLIFPPCVMHWRPPGLRRSTCSGR